MLLWATSCSIPILEMRCRQTLNDMLKATWSVGIQARHMFRCPRGRNKVTEAEPTASDRSSSHVALVGAGGSSCHRSHPASHGSCDGSKSSNKTKQRAVTIAIVVVTVIVLVTGLTVLLLLLRVAVTVGMSIIVLGKISYGLGTGVSCFYSINSHQKP